MLIVQKLATILIVPLIRLPFKQFMFLHKYADFNQSSIWYRMNVTLAFFLYSYDPW